MQRSNFGTKAFHAAFNYKVVPVIAFTSEGFYALTIHSLQHYINFSQNIFFLWFCEEENVMFLVSYMVFEGETFNPLSLSKLTELFKKSVWKLL